MNTNIHAAPAKTNNRPENIYSRLDKISLLLPVAKWIIKKTLDFIKSFTFLPINLYHTEDGIMAPETNRSRVNCSKTTFFQKGACLWAKDGYTNTIVLIMSVHVRLCSFALVHFLIRR